METQWITWALQGLIVAVLYWFKQQLDKNTDALTDLREDLPKTYIPRAESEATRKELRDANHDTRNDMVSIRDRVSKLEGANDLVEQLATALKR